MKGFIYFAGFGILAWVAYRSYLANKEYEKALSNADPYEEFKQFKTVDNKLVKGSSALDTFEELKNSGGINELTINVMQWWNGWDGR